MRRVYYGPSDRGRKGVGCQVSGTDEPRSGGMSDVEIAASKATDRKLGT